MMNKSRAFRLTGMLVVLLGATAVQAQYFLVPGPGPGGKPPTGLGAQIGTGLPLPAGPIFVGGMMTATAGTPFWPPLGIPPATNVTPGAKNTIANPARTIMQDKATTMGGKITVPVSAFTFPADGVLNLAKGLFPTNPAVFEVDTNNTFLWPKAPAVFSSGGGPGAKVFGAPKVAGIAAYKGGVKAFGGGARFAGSPGAASGTFRVPKNAMGIAPIATVWINALKATPYMVMTVGVVGQSVGPAKGVPHIGAPLASSMAPVTSMFGPLMASTQAAYVNKPVGGMLCTMYCVGPKGTIPRTVGGATSTLPKAFALLSNGAASSQGFPWTTGFISVTAGGASPEAFFLSGMDNRVAGAGNISLVSSSLSTRTLSGPNANRGWVSLNLPEPSVALGAAGALAMLALCHGLVRRRSR